MHEENSEISELYWECEQNCRKHTDKFRFFPFFHSFSFPIFLILAFVNMARGNFNTKTWLIPLNMILPFDNYVWFWFIKWTIQCTAATMYAICVTSVTSYFVSIFNYIYAMCDHINVLIGLTTKNVERLYKEKNALEAKIIRHQIVLQMCDIVKFHIKIYEWVYTL